MTKSALISGFWLIVCVVCSRSALAQEALAPSKDGPVILAYSMNTVQMEWCLKKDSIPLDRYLGQHPIAVYDKDSLDLKGLPNGHYLLVRILDNRIQTDIEEVSHLLVYTTNNLAKVQILVRPKDGTGGFITNAHVWVNGKSAKYLRETQSYEVPQRSPKGALVKVCAGTDTAFIVLKEEERSRMARVRLFHPGRSDNRRRMNTAIGRGTMLFNQPKYKQTDTVRLKAYILTPKGRTYHEPLSAFLKYNKDGQEIHQKLGELQPDRAGSYLLEFPLSDSLETDENYYVELKDKNGKLALERNFVLEDYELDEITNYRFRAEKEEYFTGDTIRWYVSAKDANGLNIMDAKVKLSLFSDDILDFSKDTVYVADTIWTETKPLSTNGETLFELDTRNLPPTGLRISATCSIVNAAGEIHDESADINYHNNRAILTSVLQEDSVKVVFRLNGKPTAINGFMETSGMTANDKPVSFPLTIKLDPFAEGYTFFAGKKGHFLDSTELDLDDYYNVQGYSTSRKDTLGFELDNPRGLPVTYTVFDGNQIIDRGTSEEKEIVWSKVALHPHHICKAVWEWRYRGKRRNSQTYLRARPTELNLEVAHSKVVFPGQLDTLHIAVRDQKGKAVPNMDMIAFSFNSQFGNNVLVPGLINTASYKPFHHLDRDCYEEAPVLLDETVPLPQHKAWMNYFGLDTMLYYQMLYPKEYPFVVSSYLPRADPQLNVFVVKGGVPQPIYMIYLNRNLVYYNGQTDHTPYLFQVSPGYTQITVRLRDQEITLDSVYTQPYYKEMVVLDLNHLPANTRVMQRPTYYTVDEVNLLRSSMWVSDAQTPKGSYIWQADRIYKMYDQGTHIIGPFQPGGLLHYFAPDQYNLYFHFEPEYSYRLSPGILRLERYDILQMVKGVANLPFIAKEAWRLNDTLMPMPDTVIRPKARDTIPFLLTNPESTYRLASSGAGQLLIKGIHMGELMYIVLDPKGQEGYRHILSPRYDRISYISPALYTVLLVNKQGYTAVIPAVRILGGQTLCLNADSAKFLPHNELINELSKEAIRLTTPTPAVENKAAVDPAVVEQFRSYPAGFGSIKGVVLDQNGKLPIPYATVRIAGYANGVQTDKDGTFHFDHIQSGTFVLYVSVIGYEPRNVKVTATEDMDPPGTIIRLHLRESALDEVVVVGYGVQSHKEFTSVSYALAGKVAGMAIEGPSEERRDSDWVNKAGVVAKAMRSDFRDYGFWKPQIITDVKGNAQVEVRYPDNVTSWRTYVMGTDPRHRVAYKQYGVMAYKPILAELHMPSFLLEGDSTDLVGTALNYTRNSYAIITRFNAQKGTTDTILGSSSSIVQYSPLVAPSNQDSVAAFFELETSNHYKDGETRKIPILKMGSQEARGQFFYVGADTTVFFQPKPDLGPVSIHAFNSTLDFVWVELKYLKEYPYFCNEQISSKIAGLLAQKSICKMLDTSFDGEEDLTKLTQKLLKTQDYSGGWPWWAGEKPDLYITSYVINAVQPLRNDPLVENAVRNGLLYLQNQLSELAAQMQDKRPSHIDIEQNLLRTLLTLKESGHVMDYTPYDKWIHFDSLDVEGKWSYVRMEQLMEKPDAAHLTYLLNKRIDGVLGDVHWGNQTYCWYSDEIAATAMAYKVLKTEDGHANLLPGIIQYLISHEENSYRNTVSAAILSSLLLPDIMAAHQHFSKPAVVSIKGDTTINLTSFPAHLKVNPKTSQPWTISKSGGGYTYLSFSQQFWNPDAKRVDSLYNIRTRLLQDDQEVKTLVIGKKAELVVSVSTNEDAQYLMLEIPIPAGCTYLDRDHWWGWNEHVEFLKNKVMVFLNNLSPGEHTFHVPLEVRYSGRYTLNPAKVCLMYYPFFYGRDDMHQVNIRE